MSTPTKTPNSSRSSYVRGRKRINPHPVAALRQSTSTPYQTPNGTDEDAEPTELSLCSTDESMPFISCDSSNEFINSIDSEGQERSRKNTRYTLRKKT